MGPYEDPESALIIAFNRGLYLALIIHRYEGPLSALTIAVHRGLYLAIIMDRYEGPKLPLLYPGIETCT
jgi:hypothetical protein